jgi:hypothetical protein
MLREIETNSTFRTEIVTPADSLLPITWESSNFPADIKQKIISRTPTYLECVGRICDLSDKCTLTSSTGKDVYAQEITITSTLDIVKYRTMKLFCWSK